MYLSKATNDDIFLFMAADIFDAIESCCRTSCGYTSVKKIFAFILFNNKKNDKRKKSNLLEIIDLFQKKFTCI